jgi:hypothetical protein
MELIRRLNRERCHLVSRCVLANNETSCLSIPAASMVYFGQETRKDGAEISTEQRREHLQVRSSERGEDSVFHLSLSLYLTMISQLHIRTEKHHYNGPGGQNGVRYNRVNMYSQKHTIGYGAK